MFSAAREHQVKIMFVHKIMFMLSSLFTMRVKRDVVHWTTAPIHLSISSSLLPSHGPKTPEKT